MSDEHQQFDHERSDARVGPVVLFALALAGLSAAVFVLMAWSFGAMADWSEGRDEGQHPMVSDALPPGPRLQANPGRELDEYEERMTKMESEYAWVDPQGGIVRIPVERALDLFVNEASAATGGQSEGGSADGESGGQR